MFKKRNRNFRGRRKETGSEDEASVPSNDTNTARENGDASNTGSEPIVIDDQDTADTSSRVKVKKVKKKKDKDKSMPKSSSVLSFENEEDDGEAELFKLKKSSHSKRVAKQLKKELQKEKEQTHSTICTGGQYDKKSLQNLKEEQDERNGEKVPSPGPGSDVDFSDFEDEENEKEPTFKDMINSGLIPDANMIHEIRKRRQLAREQGDFIPLDDTVKVENAKSRLIREDDNDMSDDDARIDFSVGTNREAELRNIQKTIIQANDESHSDGSEHEWEKQQIRKGVGITSQIEDAGSQDSSNYAIAYGGGGSEAGGFHMCGMPQVFHGDSGKRTIQVADLPAISLELIRKRLKDRLEDMQSVHRVHTNEQQDLASRLASSESEISESSERKQPLENQYRFFQEMRGYVTDLVECLNEKVPMINHLEKSLLKLWQKRAEKILERRQQDVKDESQDCLQSLDKNKLPDPSSMDQAKMRRMAEREARRNRRRRDRQKKKTDAKHNEGLSTDDEQNPSELAHYNSEKDRLTTEAMRLFEDVESDFCELDAIKQRFERWSDEQGQSYHEAYIALCLPKLFTPFIKLKLLDWNPLTSGISVNLTLQDWYESLMFYGYKKDRKVEKSDDDLKLLPNIMEKAIIPKITVLVESVWDPMSSSQTKNLVSCLTHFITSYPTLSADSKHTKGLIKAVVQRIRKTLDDDVFMPLYPKSLCEAKGVAYSFFLRQFWQACKLLGSILLWHGLVDQSALVEMALEALLNRYIVLGLLSAPVSDELITRCQMIASKFPKAWFAELSDSGSTLPQLESFCRVLLQLARTVYEQAEASKRDYEKLQARENIKKLAKILINIHAMDHSMELANHYSVKVQQL